MNSVHVRVKIVGLLQQGDLQGVLQMAGRLERIEQRDPMLSELIRTVKLRLDQIEEDEQDVQNNENEIDESDIEDDDEGAEDGFCESDDGENADISDDDDEDVNTDANDSGICVSD
eukprot:TRINITY_DN74292_c0_g1_i1.p1 TRINITY_DN74292_c0_g1~~TRINITY_DN74292_c0_g1_i1.p1  ORF type:complete len:116 (-),score=52.58 TRINITY_DN74292_c0_g1_i1:16-363(-)